MPGVMDTASVYSARGKFKTCLCSRVLHTDAVRYGQQRSTSLDEVVICKDAGPNQRHQRLRVWVERCKLNRNHINGIFIQKTLRFIHHAG